MTENENESLGTESDENEGATSDASSNDSETDAPAKAAASEQKQQEIDWETAFKHPRFKELVDQKNQAVESQRSLEQKLAQLENRFQQPSQSKAEAQQKDDLIEDLRRVDPRLAERLEKATKSFSTIEALQSKLESFEKQSQEAARNQAVQTAVAKINSLHDANKVSPEVKQMINDKLDLMYMQGKLSLQNLDESYKANYDVFKKYEDSLKRSITESYVADKKKDASVPTSQPKGAPAKPASKKPNWSKDPETARAQVVSRFLKQQSSNKNADAV